MLARREDGGRGALLPGDGAVPKSANEVILSFVAILYGSPSVVARGVNKVGADLGRARGRCRSCWPEWTPS